MPSPFDKITKTDQLENYAIGRQEAAKLAQDNQSIFQSELTKLSLDEKQNEVNQKRIDAETTGRFNTEVIAKSKTQEDFAENARKFFSDPNNAASSRNLQDYVGQVKTMFEDPLAKKTKEYASETARFQLEETKRQDEFSRQMQKDKLKLAGKQAALEQLKATQDRNNLLRKQIEQNTGDSNTLYQTLAEFRSDKAPAAYAKYMDSIADFYDNGIRDLPSNDKRRFELLNEAHEISRPLTTFQQQYSILQQNFAQTHSDTIARIRKDYSDDYDSWARQLQATGVPPEKINITGYIKTLFDEKDTSGKAGYAISQTPDGAKLLSDFMRLEELKGLHKGYQESFKSAFATNSNGENEFRRDRIGNLRTKGVQLEQSMNTAIGSLGVSIKQEADELRNRNIESQINARNKDNFDEDQKRAIKVTVDLIDTYEQQYRNVANANKDSNGVVTTEGVNALKPIQEEIDKARNRLKSFLSGPTVDQQGQNQEDEYKIPE